MRKFIILAGIFLCTPVSADVLVRRDGTETEGAFAGMTKESVLFTDENGESRNTPREHALKVLFVNRRNSVPNYPADEELASAAQSTLTASDFGNEAAANWLRLYKYTLRPDSSALRAQRIIRKLFLEEGRDAVGNAKFYYHRKFEQAGLDYALSLTGTTAAFADATTIISASETPDFPEYDETASLKFSIPRVSTGSAADYMAAASAAVTSPEFSFFDRVPLLDRYPARQIRIEITAPENITILSTASTGVTLSKVSDNTDGGMRTEIWTAQNTPAKVRAAKYMPVFCFGQAAEWRDIGAYFSEKIDDILNSDNFDAPPFEAGDTETQKARKLYQAVSDRLIFAPVSMPLSSYIPKPASETLRRGSGNMLDKPFTLYALLLKSGIKASLVYADTREDPAFFKEVPSIRQTAEAVILAELDGVKVWLAPMETETEFGWLPPRLQDCDGLIVHGPGTGELVRTPLLPPSASALSVKADMQLDTDGNMQVKAENSFTGNYASAWRQYRQITEDEQRKGIESELNALYPGTELNDFKFSGLDSLSAPLSLTADYKLQAYALSAGGKYLAFQVPLMKKTAENAVLDARETELDLQSTDSRTMTVTIACPADYMVYYLPPPLAMDKECCSYKAGYSKTDSGIALREEFTIKTPRIKPGDYPAYRDFIRGISEYSRNYVVLKKIYKAP